MFPEVTTGNQARPYLLNQIKYGVDQLCCTNVAAQFLVLHKRSTVD